MEMIAPMMDMSALLSASGNAGQGAPTGLSPTEVGASAFMALLNQAVVSVEGLATEPVPTEPTAQSATTPTANTLAAVPEIKLIQMDQEIAAPVASVVATAAEQLLVVTAEPAEASQEQLSSSAIETSQALTEEMPTNTDAAAQAILQQLLVTPVTLPADKAGTQLPVTNIDTVAKTGQQHQIPDSISEPVATATAEPANGQNSRISSDSLATLALTAGQNASATNNQTTTEARQEILPRFDQKMTLAAQNELQRSPLMVEAEIASESVTASGTMPRDMAIEVAISEISSTAVEQGQEPGTAGQQQDTANEQNSAHALMHNSKSVTTQSVTPGETAAVSVNPESLLEQVKERLSAPEIRTEGNQIRLQLRPADLGELQITLRMDDQKLRVEILAENKAVKAALLEHADTLKDILARQHITIDRFDVGTGRNNGFGHLFREGGRPEDQRSFSRYASGSSFKQQDALPVTAWQPRGNALVDVRF